MSRKPSYINAFKNGTLRAVNLDLQEALSHCELCPRKCGVDRTNNELGICKTGLKAKVSSASPHFGEEPPLVGTRGSGTIFFTHCNLLCTFCQNYDISHEGYGREVDDSELADLMIRLQLLGCHNINLVTPSHVVPQILNSLEVAIEKGLQIPLVYNTSSFDNVDTLKYLDGIVDIYMPDLKFFDPKLAQKTCDAPNYPDVAREAILEMHRQVGNLKLDSGGIAQQGLLIRHLVMPGLLDDTRRIMKFIANEISPETFVNIMPQYRPCGNLDKVPELNRGLYQDEYDEAIRIAKEEGLFNFLN